MNLKTIDSIDIEATIQNARKLLDEDQGISPALKASFELLLLVITLMTGRLGLNSKNSSNPPSSDPNREKKARKPSNRKPGGQKGHIGKTLQKVAEPDFIKDIKIDPSELPKGKYKKIGFESRQVVDLKISMEVTEYRAEILKNANGKKYVAKFPKGIDRPIQYGINAKAHAVYQSQYQLIPYQRVEEYFRDQVNIPLSSGSIYNFNEEAYNSLELFEQVLKTKLINADVCHADETGINVQGKRFWLHCISNDSWTYFMPHEKRGGDAIDAMGVIPGFKGILCHDHWKPYFKYECKHSLCNAHHLRELERAFEQDKQEWAEKMQLLLLEINEAIDNSEGQITKTDQRIYRDRYRLIIKEAQSECPPPDETKREGKRGRLKRSKSRNLLERLEKFEKETLLFMEKEEVPFTNNRGENDIRMTKVHQKISGCFRSTKGAEMFCRIRSYISTCKKNQLGASDALNMLFNGVLPDFITSESYKSSN